jgi:mannose-6-phosphate isomerase
MTLDVRPHAQFSPASVQPKPWGHERIYAHGEHGYVGKILAVLAGEGLSLQYHADKDETIVVVSGEGLIEHGPAVDLLVPRRLRPGDVVHLPATVLHRITAVTDLVLAQASTAAPGWQDDVVRLQDRYGRDGTTHP